MRNRDGCVHNQEALRHFLEVERARAARHGCPILVVVIGVRPSGQRLSTDVATGIFFGLGKGLREVDVIGWLREERIAGAVLTAGTRRPTPEDSRTIARRVQNILRECIPSGVADHVKVRVIQVQPD